MPDQISSASEMRRTGGRFVGGGIAAVVAIILIGAGLLLWALPDANAFNAQVERIFVEHDDLTTQAEIKLLEILAQSGTAFSETLSSYRIVIIVLLVFATAMPVAALVSNKPFGLFPVNVSTRTPVAGLIRKFKTKKSVSRRCASSSDQKPTSSWWPTSLPP